MISLLQRISMFCPHRDITQMSALKDGREIGEQIFTSQMYGETFCITRSKWQKRNTWANPLFPINLQSVKLPTTLSTECLFVDIWKLFYNSPLRDHDNILWVQSEAGRRAVKKKKFLWKPTFSDTTWWGLHSHKWESTKLITYFPKELSATFSKVSFLFY